MSIKFNYSIKLRNNTLFIKKYCCQLRAKFPVRCFNVKNICILFLMFFCCVYLTLEAEAKARNAERCTPYRGRPVDASCQSRTKSRKRSTSKQQDIFGNVSKISTFCGSDGSCVMITTSTSGQRKLFRGTPEEIERRKQSILARRQAGSLPGSTSTSGFQGCVWKGRAYAVGASIYHTEGRIMSSDLRINGQDFGSLSGRAGPWQQCECSTSSRRWGCV
jgi:hypothetical protein